ncbi:hypothetical protein [Spirosoma endbachense]|uniref:Uncharacterized protein n=1 Tax=Spirosoma endbachense TaxID=2666025 RepID=A0A6P1W6X6_9BACT|nr:hypothetical protein [Spirosoma endbachense]QHW00329.1 hypothetical protein GJR95_37245 [Spirosoma endbachense]
MTTSDLSKILGARYTVVYVPTQISLSTELLTMLIACVKQGGRLVLDVPAGYCVAFTAQLHISTKTPIKQLTSVTIREY